MKKVEKQRCHRVIDEGVLIVAAVARVCDVVESFSQFANEMIGHQFHIGVSYHIRYKSTSQ